MIQYNDYELLYLMNEFDEEAERILFEKYTNLIKAKIRKFKVKSRYKDDFMQEGYYMLMIAIRTYDEFSNKTFNKYFDLILHRKFMRIISKEKNYFNSVEFSDDETIIKDSNSFSYNNVEIGNLSSFEEEVVYFKKRNYKPREIAKILQCDVKSVYNCLCRIKNKYNK